MLMQHYLFLQKSSIINKESPKGVKTLLIKLIKNLKTNWDLIKIKHNPDVIVWITEENHLAQVFPVLDILKDKGVRILVLSSKSILLKKAADEGLLTLQITLPAIRRASQKENEQFENKLRKVIESFNDSCFSEDQILLILDSYEINFRYIKQLKKLIGNLIRKLQPKVFLAGYDLPMEGRTFTYLCNKEKIHTLMIQHGAIAKVDQLFSQLLVNKYMVYGEEPKSVLKSSGCKCELFITGAPYLDKIILNNLPVQIGLYSRKIRVLIAFSGPGHLTSIDHHVDSVNAIIEIAGKYKEIDFYFKLHNKDNICFYLDAMHNEKWENVFFRLPDSDSKNILDWLMFSDILITGASSVAIEAMLYKKPVISLDLKGDYNQLIFVKSGAVKYITTKNKLEEVISTVIKKGDTGIFNENLVEAEKYVKSFYGPLDGKSAERCATIIEESLARSKK